MFLDFVALGSLLIKSGGTITLQLVGVGADPEESLWRFGFSGVAIRCTCKPKRAARTSQATLFVG